MLGYHPSLQPNPPPPGGQPPPGADTPRSIYTPQDQVSPSGPGTPPCAVDAGRYGQQAGGMHPTGMQSCYCSYLCIVMFKEL